MTSRWRTGRCEPRDPTSVRRGRRSDCCEKAPAIGVGVGITPLRSADDDGRRVPPPMLSISPGVPGVPGTWSRRRDDDDTDDDSGGAAAAAAAGAGAGAGAWVDGEKWLLRPCLTNGVRGVRGTLLRTLPRPPPVEKGSAPPVVLLLVKAKSACSRPRRDEEEGASRSPRALRLYSSTSRLACSVAASARSVSAFCSWNRIISTAACWCWNLRLRTACSSSLAGAENRRSTVIGRDPGGSSG